MVAVPELLAMPLIGLALLSVLALLWIVFEATRKPGGKDAVKTAAYTCGTGQEPSEFGLPEKGLYSSLNRFFRTSYISRLHSGNLTDYLVWIVIGTAAIMAALVVLA